MSAGQWVFPSAMLVFLIFLAGFVVSNPGLPPGEERMRALLVAQPGDNVTIEVTRYYDEAARYISDTTREELQQSGELDRQPYPPGFSSDPITVTLPPDLKSTDRSPIAPLLGHRIGDTFETPQYRNLYGDWSFSNTLNTTLVVLERRVEYSGYEYVLFASGAEQELGRAPAVGDAFACEPELPTPCEIVELDPAANRIAYRRLVAEGDAWPIADFRSFVGAFVRGTPVPQNHLEARHVNETHFELSWRLNRGDLFSLAQAVGEWTPGAYAVDALGDGTATVRYAAFGASGQVAAHLVGQAVWFEFTLVDIERP